MTIRSKAADRFGVLGLHSDARRGGCHVDCGARRRSSCAKTTSVETKLNTARTIATAVIVRGVHMSH